MILRHVGRWLAYLLIFFFTSTILAVVAFKYIPVYYTPLMVLRCMEQIADGRTPKIDHQWVPLSQMSHNLPQAVVASEDNRFLEHHGFDTEEIARAYLESRRGGRERGASTISQQTAKNVFLWPGRSWTRKGFEVYFTALIELMWSKQRIMEVYLNSIEMGNGIYGADAVAEYHFSKTAKDLSRAECALVAATLPNPRKMDSAHPTPYLRKRRSAIEHEMRFIPTFPKEGEDINPDSAAGGVYHRKRQ